jgi:hypothetical protein
VRRTAGLQANQARRQFGEKLQDIGTPKLPAHSNLARRIHPVDLKYVLGSVEPDCANRHYSRHYT